MEHITEIKTDYSLLMKEFRITEPNLPKYTNPSEFANTFKKCSLHEYSNVCYSTSSNSVGTLGK